MKLRSTCPLCTSSEMAEVTERPNVPVHQNKLYETRADARAATRGHLKVVACLTCGFVFNAAFDLSLMSYDEGYENDQTHSPAFSAHVDKLADRLLSESGVRNSRIVEVGSGKGSFLNTLVMADAGNVGWGFDPAYTGPDRAVGGRVEFVRSFYDRAYADLAPDVVVCRHVIEHVPDPAMLLAEIRQASTGARVFVETPDVEWILRNAVIWDFFYEHCSYFSPHSFVTAFHRAGFGDVKSTHVFGGQYLWVEVCGTRDGDAKQTCDPGDIAQHVQRYMQEESEMLARWNDTILELRESGPLALWGAGAKGVTSASLFDSRSEIISGVVDLNPRKQGRYIAGSGHEIISPAELMHRKIKSVVLMNPNYLNEVQELLERESIDVKIIIDANVGSARE
jgi:SAM-dependent methyltransferase